MDQRVKCSCVLFLLLGASCVMIHTNSFVVMEKTALSGQSPKNEQIVENVTRVNTTLSKAGSSPWTVDETRTAGRETLRSIYFLDETRGWVGGKGVLYRTADGGRSWQHVDMRLSPSAFVTQVVFSNPMVGWVVAQQETSSPLTYQDDHFWVMQTRDGGETWKTELERRDSLVNRLRFANDREGWLVGTKYTNPVPIRAHEFILHTLDAGKHWLDVSGSLNEMLTVMPVKVEFTDILPEPPLAARVLLPRGGVFRTSDGGQTWRQLNGTIDDSSYACSCHIGVTDNERVWVGGEKDDSHSVLGMVAISEGAAWREYILFGVSFLDILFLSRDRILTCGSTTPNQQEYTEKREGVVSYSSDGGNSWSFVYHNPKVKKLNALYAVDSDHAWAVGNDGLIVRLRATTRIH
jgi:photosystem II stability/assembly factor-like uncharacterized protein